jgi:hypothetical protein
MSRAVGVKGTTVGDSASPLMHRRRLRNELRTKRRELITSEGAPKFSFVLDESVIRRIAGSPAVMSRQLGHLADLAGLANVTIQVVPFAVGLYPGTRGAFKVIEFDGEPDENVAFLEGPRGDFISDDPAETVDYLEIFKQVAQLALGPSDSAGLLREAAAKLA